MRGVIKMIKNSNRLMVIVIITTIMLLMVACTENAHKNEDSTENTTSVVSSVFDENNYDGVKAISLFGKAEVIEDTNTIEEVKKLILNVDYSETDESILDYYGTTLLIMVCNDGSSRTVSMTSELILDGGKTYKVEEDICSKIREYFN